MFGRQLIRRFTTSVVRRSDHGDEGGIPGSNIPFPIKNKYVTVAIFCAFCGSGFSIPFLMLRRSTLRP